MVGIEPVSLYCEAVLFDMDGVLVDTMPRIEHYLRGWAHARDLDPDHVIGLSRGRRYADLVRLAAPFLDAEEEALRMQKGEIAEVRGVPASEGAAELIAALPSHAWAVVTSGGAASARDRLATAGIPDPPALISADDVRAGKPDPEGYLTAARRLDVPPTRCVVFEDAPAGVAAARAAGMRVVGVVGTVEAEELRCDGLVPGLVAVRTRIVGSTIELLLQVR